MSSDGVSGSDSMFTNLIGTIQGQVAKANQLSTDIGTDAASWYPVFGDFDEAHELSNAFWETCLQLSFGVGTFNNALQDLHDGTVDIKKNYSDANNSTEYAAQNLKKYDGYLDGYVNNAVVN